MNALVFELRYGMVTLSSEAKGRAAATVVSMNQRINQLVADGSGGTEQGDPASMRFHEDLAKLQKIFGEYQVNFKKVLEIEGRREKSALLLYDRAPQVFARAADLGDYAFETSNRSVLDKVRQLQESLQKAQIEIFRFMRAPQKQASETIDGHLRDALGRAKQIIGELRDDRGTALARGIEAAVNDYKKTFFEVSATTFVGQHLFGEVMEEKSRSILALSGALTTAQQELRQAAAATAEAGAQQRESLTVWLVVLFIAIGAVLAILVVRRVVGGIRGITSAMTRLAGGEHTTEIPALAARDEIGDMARALRVFKENALHIQELQAEHNRDVERHAAERRQTLAALAESFEANVKGVVDTVSNCAESLETSAKGLSSVADEANGMASSVASSSEAASANVDAVAAAAEELNASISEIGRQADESSRFARNAVDEMKEVSDAMQRLAGSVQKIDAVVHLINSVASQTNLLALNATIEAARAGEAGKGFTVVAGEVKNLANQTAKATEDIARQVMEVQSVANAAVGAIGTVETTIGHINETASAIAAAVVEQGAATGEIARNIHHAAEGTHQVRVTIAGVLDASEATERASGDVLSEASNLSKQAERLRRDVDGLIQHLRIG